ncbi:hypothetical protein [Allokutzneria oryzae]|uniref:Protein kinase domain-containing protein n=1 Tax=Allokutzneria oryzae TaxID=1378989 RepID=A0ABV5ZWU3_9PSEU
MSLSHAERIAAHGTVSTALTLLSDQRLGRLLDEAKVLGTGIGGTASLVEIDGVRVFVKRVPLTDLERRPENVLSTANVFQLPTYLQYGVGSPGFGVWREVAANVMATNWVLGGECESFPLTYHWRVLDGPERVGLTADQLSEVDSTVEFWHGAEALRERLHANARASASVLLFQEYLPQDLHDWLGTQVEGDIEAAAGMVERELRAATSFMNSRGLFHFDAHFRNILTDGKRLYLADLGLATSSRFELSEAESEFVERNATHDECYVVMHLVNWLVTNLSGAVPPGATIPVERNDYIRRVAEGEEPVGLPPVAAAIVRRYAPVVVVVNQFYWNLFGESRATPYPAGEIERACAATGFAAAR